MSYKGQSNYVYNSTKIYKNNYPVDIDIDSISEELYSVAGNRGAVEEIIQKVENDILNSDLKKTKNDEKNLKQNNLYTMNNIYSGNKYGFRTTLPEGELMKEPIYQSNILHKKYTDVNANSKFYFPQKEDNILTEQNNYKTQWTNRANKILLESQNNINKTMISQSKHIKITRNSYKKFQMNNLKGIICKNINN